MEWASIAPVAYFSFSFGSGFPAFRFGDGDEAVQLGLELVDSVQDFIEEFHRRDLLALEEWGELGDGSGDQVFRHGKLSRP